MLRDQDIALDFLFGVKASILDLTRAAVEAENPRLKQMLIQMRNQAEQSHEEIYQILKGLMPIRQLPRLSISISRG